MKQMLLQYPKLRGFQSRYAKAATVAVGTLERLDAGASVDLAALKRAGLVARSARSAKLVGGGGALTKALTLSGITASSSARAVIEKAGGKLL
jgi:large subunit ribosomal protein L15